MTTSGAACRRLFDTSPIFDLFLGVAASRSRGLATSGETINRESCEVRLRPICCVAFHRLHT